MLDNKKMSELLELQSQAYASIANFLPTLCHQFSLYDDSLKSFDIGLFQVSENLQRINNRLDRLDAHFVEMCNALMEEI